MRLSTLVAGVTLAVAAGTASANPIDLIFTFTVSDIEYDFGSSDSAASFVAPAVIGSQYQAKVRIDDEILSVDGLVKPGKVLGFSAKVGDTAWELGQMITPSGGMTMFRGPCFGPRACTPEEVAVWSLNSEFLGFDVVGGQIITMHGSVYGNVGDVPYLDFTAPALGYSGFKSVSLFERTGAGGEGSTYGAITLLGTQSVQQVAVDVPEPGSLALVGLGAMLLGVRRMRRQRRAA